MKSFKNHLSLITALFTILFTIQIFVAVDRSIDSYEKELSKNYSLIVISSRSIKETQFQAVHPIVLKSEQISVDDVLKRLTSDMKQKNIDLLKISLPKFYRIHLKNYPSPMQIKNLNTALKKLPSISKIESFSQSHDTLYNLLILIKYIVIILAVAVFIVTSLLILKEMRIWQFQHMERMNIMALFGAPVWLRSAVLFRLAIVDAIIASILVIGTFIALNQQEWIHEQLHSVNISIDLFLPLSDGFILLQVALAVSILLASMIIMGHKEEV
ncbi:MAG: cell division protein FtsX [Campylobacterota bacterium]|nr:cell division protein FtsX [Campylobacterota bacterium]